MAIGPAISADAGSTLLSRTLARAQAGDVKAQEGLGAMYSTGNGVPQDYSQAVIWFQRAAEQGDAFAEDALGDSYEYGMGLQKDRALALRWYLKAAEQGYPEAEASIGLYYLYGDGPVTKNYPDAYFWLDLSSAGNLGSHEKAQTVKFRDVAASHLTPEELLQSQQRASKWFVDHPVPK